MNLYLIARIEKIEKTEAFQLAAEKSRERSARSLAVADDLRDELLVEIDSVEIDIPKYEPEKLKSKALRNYYQHSGRYRTKFDDHSPEFLDRITVNYLRHVSTKYDQHLESTHGRVGADIAREEIRDQVYHAIAAAYPSLARECKRQRRERPSRIHP